MKRLFLLLFCLGAASSCAEPEDRRPEVTNLIYMIGDGMGLSHVSMLMVEEGYHSTAFDRAANIALITTYSNNNRVTDSAAAGTALATGRKTDNSMLGIGPDSLPAASLIERATHDGRPTGIVVTCELQHATPGAFYAHAAHRKEYDVISRQLAASGIDVAFGGGRKALVETDSATLAPLDLLRREGYRIVEQIDSIEGIERGPVVGIFADGHLAPAKEGRGDYLPRAVDRALHILDNDARAAGKGFVMMVEGSQIDFESHANDARGILAEMRDFDRAVRCAMNFADTHPGTLVVVTADHETSGLALASGNPDFMLAESGIEYRFGTTGHSGTLVPVYLYGTGAESINGILDNTELAQRLAALLGL